MDVVAEAPDGLHVLLLVELEAVGVDGAVHVDGELGHAQQGPVDVHEPRRAVPQGEPARESEVPVEPGVEERSAVDLDGDLPPALRAHVGQRLDAQVRRVGVRADDAEGVCGAAPSGTYHATIAPPRVTYLPPFVPSHASVSATWRNPAFSRRAAAFATAWYAEGLAARKDMRSSV